MSSTSEPVHLNNHHRNTLRQIFQHPVSHNIEWHSVASLLEAVGSVVENHDGTVAATVGSETEYFEAPAHKDIDTQNVILALRRILSSACVCRPGLGTWPPRAKRIDRCQPACAATGHHPRGPDGESQMASCSPAGSVC